MKYSLYQFKVWLDQALQQSSKLKLMAEITAFITFLGRFEC